MKKQTTASVTVKKNKAHVIARILSFSKAHMWLLVLALICSTAQIIATLFAPVIIGKAIDCMVGKGNVDFAMILRYALILLGLIVTAMTFQWLSTLCTSTVSHRTVRDMREAAFNKLNRVPLSYIDSVPHGDIMSRVGVDTDLISDGLIQGFTQLFSGIVTVVGTLIFMLTVNKTVTLVVVLVTPLSIVAAYLLARATHKMFRRQADKRGEISGLSEEMLDGQRVVTAFNYQQQAEERFDKINLELKDCSTKAMFYSSITNPTTRLVNGIVYAAVALVGAIIVIRDPASLSIGLLSCFLAYANQYTKPFNEITGVVTELQTATGAARRVFELIDEKEEPSDDGLPVMDYCDGSIELCNIKFGYSPDKVLISDLSLSVLPGQRVAIVGPTGCGKTTLINLLMRFYDPLSGTITVSETPSTSVTRDSYRDKFGMVLQDSWLFSGTVRDNIAYAKRDATQEEIEDAAKRAHIHGFISRLPNGYDTLVDEEGSGISQGQKQLLCIARIMLATPPMLILDEATSSIDTRTEQRIQSAFALMMRGRTSFIIAHRLSTIRDADMILVMRDGNVIEKGTHDELIAQGGFYRDLYNSQFD